MYAADAGLNFGIRPLLATAGNRTWGALKETPRLALFVGLYTPCGTRIPSLCADVRDCPRPTLRSIIAMAVIDQILGEAALLVARQVSDVPTATPSPTESPTSSGTPPATTSPAKNDNSGNGGSSSPLLFFVALGFGVVFTNLW